MSALLPYVTLELLSAGGSPSPVRPVHGILYPIIIFNPYEFVKSILPNISFEVNTANSYFSPIFTVSVFIGTQV